MNRENDPLEPLVETMLKELGEDAGRDGLQRTPARVAESMRYFTSGYRQDPIAILNNALFDVSYDEMVMVKDIEFYSLCEHHLLPFFGRVHVAYIPDGRILGLSKIPRIVDVFARRLQVQERMTQQIAQAVQTVLEPKGVGVVAHASHLCMMMRGVQKQNSSAMTSCLLGSFRSDSKTRNEFMGLVRSFTRQ